MVDNSSRRILIALCFLTLSLTQGEGCNPSSSGSIGGGGGVENDLQDVEGKSIFTIVPGDASSDVRCKAKGVQGCFFVNLDTANLDSLVGTGEYVKAFNHKDIEIKVSSKTGNYYVFDGKDFQQSSMTIRQRENGPSIYGSIRTNSGVYNIEACSGTGGCNVAAFVPNDFFAQLESQDDAVSFGGQ